jgi:SHAQKYF class myb-like DNA-binding protein
MHQYFAQSFRLLGPESKPKAIMSKMKELGCPMEGITRTVIASHFQKFSSKLREKACNSSKKRKTLEELMGDEYFGIEGEGQYGMDSRSFLKIQIENYSPSSDNLDIDQMSSNSLEPLDFLLEVGSIDPSDSDRSPLLCSEPTSDGF